jgi:hypothetical protein
MRLGELLVGQGLLAPEDLEAALQRQKEQGGGRLGTHLVAMGLITVDKLLVALRASKRSMPRSGCAHARCSAG